MVAHAFAALVPQPAASVPVAATNVPRFAATTHGSLTGSSVFGWHVELHPAPAG
jgi:hypothetical protein